MRITPAEAVNRYWHLTPQTNALLGHPDTAEDGQWRNVTVGRRKRKRKAGAGTGVKIKGHTRSPRGPNKGKKRVRVDGHARGKPPKKGGRRRSR